MTDYTLSIGVLLLSSWANFSLFTLEILNIHHYFRHFPHDSRINKSAVSLSLVCDASTVFANAAVVWLYTIEHFDDPSYIQTSPWPLPLYVVTTSISAVIAQVFLSFRIYRFSRSAWIVIVLCCLSLASLAGAIVSAVRLVTLKDIEERVEMTSTIILWLAGSASVDISLSVVLVYNLYRGRRNTANTDEEFNFSKSLLRSLSYQTLRTGCITAMIALLTIILFKTHPESNLCVMTGMILGRLYTITYVANLNARPRLTTTSNAQALSACNGLAPTPLLLDTSIFEKTLSSTHLDHPNRPTPRHSLSSFSFSNPPRRGSSPQNLPNLDEFRIDITSDPSPSPAGLPRRSSQFASWRNSIMKGAEESEADFRGVAPTGEKGRKGSVASRTSFGASRKGSLIISPRGSKTEVPTMASIRSSLPVERDDDDEEFGMRPPPKMSGLSFDSSYSLSAPKSPSPFGPICASPSASLSVSSPLPSPGLTSLADPLEAGFEGIHRTISTSTTSTAVDYEAGGPLDMGKAAKL